MSTRDRYTKIIESLVNGDEASASDLLHEAFVEKAREIWNDIVEADEIVEDGVAEEEIEEAIGNEEADDFLDDIETDEQEIEAEEAFGEGEDDLDDLESADELGGDDEMAPDFDMDGETDEHEEEHGDIEDKLVSVEDALSDLKAEFAKIMGDDDLDGEEEMDMDMDMEAEPEVESFAFEADEADEEAEELEEAADLQKVGKDGAVHPVAMPAGDDGKASPVAGKNDMGGVAVDPTKDSKGSDKGLSDKSAKDMGVTHPGDGAKLSPETRGHGAEKKGKTA
jgi:hypothetical protein|tara:strand:- start:461 stop:1303 length:843 start_codon:yes stop_codon:yes gene_type:complete